MEASSHNVVVVGAGVAGATFSILAERLPVNIRVYEMSRSYLKPCGEAIPSTLLGVLDKHGLPKPRILNSIKSFMVYAGSELVKELVFGEPVWYIIDKKAWIESMRERIGENVVYRPVRMDKAMGGSREVLIVDARGPFGQSGARIPVWRAYGELPGWPKDTVALVFTGTPHVGLAWIFPHGDIVNVGAGFIGVRDPRGLGEKLLTSIARSTVGHTVRLTSEAFSLITVEPDVKLAGAHGLRLGEAAGLINPLGGEGIRPAVLSAIAAYNALRAVVERGSPRLYDEYRRRVKPLIASVRLQKRLLSLAKRVDTGRLKTLLSWASKRVYKKWFRGELGLVDVLTAPL